MKVHEAVTAVMEDVGAVRKDGRNTQQNFNFRGVDAVVNAVSPAMRKHGLICRPSKVDHRPSSKQLSGGKMATSIDVIVDYTFTGPEGDSFTAQVAAESFDLGDKATAKAMSVAYRTCLLQTFALPTDDNDPDEQTYEREARQPVQQGPDWAAQYKAATGNAQALQALRHTAKNAGAPDDFWLFARVAADLEALKTTEPLEGKIV